MIKHTHTRLTALSGNTQVSRYQKSKTNLDFTEARDNEWQWHQLDHMQVCTLLQTDNQPAPHHSSVLQITRQITMPAPHHCFLQAGCPSCRPTNSLKALEVKQVIKIK